MPPYAYICAGNRPPGGGFAGDDALTVIDLGNPLVPAFEGVIEGSGAPNFLDNLTNVAIKGSYAYVCACSENRLVVINISNPAAPSYVTSLAVPGIYDIKIKGDYAFVTTSWNDELVSIDISDPSNPSVADTVTFAGWTTVSVYILGDYAYVAASGTLFVVDISDPTNISEEGHIENPGAPDSELLGCCYVIVEGSYAYVSAIGSDTFTVVNVSNPAIPSIEGFLALTEGPVGLYKVGDYVYVCVFGDWTFQIIDVSAPATPSLVASFDIAAALGAGNPRPREVIVIGDHAYVTEGDGNAAWDGLVVIDISDPLTMSIVGSIFGGGAPNYLLMAYGIAIPITATLTGAPPSAAALLL